MVHIMANKQEIIKLNKDIELIGNLCGTSWDRADYDNCECGKGKLRYAVFCKDCEKGIEDKFKKIMQDNFKAEEIQVIDKVIEGYLLEEILKGEK